MVLNYVYKYVHLCDVRNVNVKIVKLWHVTENATIMDDR
jgi:hypothetical protein